MHSLEAACNEAENLINKFELFGARTDYCCYTLTQGFCSSVPGPSWSNGIHNQSLVESSRKSRVFNICQHLRELYLEECRNVQPFSSLPSPLKNLKRGSKLLEKLVQRDNLNTLIVNLYPGNKGYSLSLRLQGKVPAALGNQAGRSQGSEPVIETMRWPYSDEELLRCIDNEEIPATLVDLLEANHSELFYQGCVIAEIRDYRLTFPLYSFETHHVLLKPTTQSIINDVNIISSSQDFSAEDRLSLESQIVLATAPPLCLDPNPAIGILINNLQHKKQRLSTTPLRRTARKFSQVTVNRKRKLDQFTSHNSLHLYDFITRKKVKLRNTNQGKQSKKIIEGALPPPPPVPVEEIMPLQPPSIKPDVFKYAKHYEKSRDTTDCSVYLIEEYILETERGQGRIYRIKLSILQRHSNMEYLGELYVDRDYKEGERSGASCRFVLGTRVHANRYIQQFTEIFTEEGRKSVRITHVIPGQQHQVSYTPGMRERNAVAQAQSASSSAQGKLTASVVNNTQSNISNHSSNLQHILPNPQQLTVHTQHTESTSGNTINYSMNSPQIQKLHGQLNTNNANVLLQNPNTNSNIQINSVSHLTSLLGNSSVTAPPNVNIHQIQQAHSVLGITGQSLSSLAQPVQNIVSVQNLGITNSSMNTPTIQSLLSNALTTSVLNDEGINLMNGPVTSGVNDSQSLASNSTSNATIHHPSTQSQTPTKPSRPSLATNPAISALVTSLMNSAQQFQVQQAAQQAANSSNSANVQSTTSNISQSSTSSNNQNSTILSLLNATSPLTINSSNNVITTSHLNLSQQSQKLLTRKTITNLLGSRLINQNLSAVLNNSAGNPTLVVNNTNSQQLRVTLSSLNQLMNTTNQNAVNSNQAPQILNIGNVNQISGSSNLGTGFTLAATQGNLTIATQTANLTTQTFTIANADSQTFTITSPNPVQDQTYSLNTPAISSLTQPQSQTFTITSNSGSISPQSFTLPSASSNNLANSNASFSLSSSQNSGSQPQTFTVLQSNQNLGNQSFTIATPVGNQGFTVTKAPTAVGNQAFTISNTSLSPVPNKSFQINNSGSTNQTFTITTPGVTVPNQFVNRPSSAANQNFSPQSSTQTFTMNASTQPTNTSSVFTVNSSVPNQVFTVNIQPPSSKQGFNQTFSNSSQSNQNKALPSQNSVLINKNQSFTVNANNKNVTVSAPVIAKNIDNANNSGNAGKNTASSSSNISIGNYTSGNDTISSNKGSKDSNNSGRGNNSNNNNNHSNNNSNNKNNNNNNNSGSSGGGGGSSSSSGGGGGNNNNDNNNNNNNSNNNNDDDDDDDDDDNGYDNSNNNDNNSNNDNDDDDDDDDDNVDDYDYDYDDNYDNNDDSSCGNSNVNTGRVAACQRRLSNALQQASQNSELNKLLLERCDNRILMDTNKLVNDKNDSENPKLNQALRECKTLVSESNKLSLALSSDADAGTNQSVTTVTDSSSTCNLGLSMPGLSALLAGTPSADNPIPGASNSSTLLERLASSAPSATAFSSPPLPVTPQSPSASALSPNQAISFQNNSFSASPSNNNNNNNNNSSSSGSSSNNNNNNNNNNSVNSNSPSPTITSPVPNFSSSSPKNQVQLQSSSPNPKEVLGVTTPLSSPPAASPVSLNLQSLSLQGITGLQNIQVSISSLPMPILSLNVANQASGTQGVLMTSLPVAPTTNTTTTTSVSPIVLSNSANAGSGGNVLSLPVAHLMTSGVKNSNQRTPAASSCSLTQGTSQSIQLVSSVQKPSNRPISQNQGNKSSSSIPSRGMLNAQKNTLKTSGNSESMANSEHGNQMLAYAAQQQLQLAKLQLHKQAQMQQCYQQNQKRPVSPSSLAAKHRRRSNAADSNK